MVSESEFCRQEVQLSDPSDTELAETQLRELQGCWCTDNARSGGRDVRPVRNNTTSFRVA